jgi:predicted ABC-type ATPase
MVPYTPPKDIEVPKSKTKLPKPKIGDIVRYYDIDGGQATGQVLVGKISLIQAIIGTSSSNNNNNAASTDGTNKWLVEITEMEDVGEGYYAEYPSRKRRKSALRKLEDIAPLPASYVRSEDAFKIPMERGTNRPLPSHVGYNLVEYEGPMAVPINRDVVQADSENYQQIKLSLLRNAAIAGAAGTVGVDLFRGTEDAIIYAAGALAGVAYLFFLGIKTDTLGGRDSKLGSNVSNLRFLFPALVIGGVALNNVMRGDGNPVSSPGIFSTVTPEQFGAAMIGFLTYRLPLFVSQLSPVVSDTATDMIPGSAAMALRMAADAKKRGVDMSSLNNSLSSTDNNLVTVLLVSGPEGTGKTTLVNKLLERDTRFVRPIMIDRISDAVKFERLEQRGELLDMDATGRYALSSEGVLEAAARARSDINAEGNIPEKVVVVDADVNLARKLVNLSGARLIGVWIGLDDLEKFESRLKSKIASGGITIPDDETEDSILRAKVRQVVKDIEYGVVSG